MQRKAYSVFVIVLIFGMMTGLVQPVFARPADPGETRQQIGPYVEPDLLNQIQANDQAGYLIYFGDKPDLSAAEGMDWEARGTYVMQTLQQAAERSQAEVRAYLNAQGVKYQAFWIENVISVEGSDQGVFNQLQTYPEIEALRSHRVLGLIEPQKEPVAQNQVMAIEPNLVHIGAPDAWNLGIDGSGLVVANIDTGVRYSHAALAPHYRGNLGGGAFDHNYNWWDPFGVYSFPVDENGHGTHTMGTMVGDDGGSNKIGVAPGAEWIACRACTTSVCSDAAMLACGQFVAAPWDLTGANPNPSLRPQVVNNSWGDCSQTYDDWYQGVVDAWHAAGIYPVFSNGNASNCGYSNPPGLNTVGNPARYGNVTGVGSSGESNGLYADHSNWGPTDNPDTLNPRGYPYLKPQVLAPGVSIRSSVNSSDTAYQDGWSGTSMSAPHVSGLVALVWQAAPCLVGDYVATETLIEETANPVPYASAGFPPPGPGNVPNYASGWGEIDALAAVQAAMGYCGDSTLAGSVTHSVSGLPVAGAQIVAVDGAATRTSFTNDSGGYTMSLPEGPYNVTASAYGFFPLTINGLAAVSGQTTVQDFPLTPRNTHLVSGYVTDQETGWPLYAQISIAGYPGGSVWTDPVTGYYEVELPEGTAFTFKVDVWTGGYASATTTIGPLTGDLARDFAMQVILNPCTAPGYQPSGIFALAESFYGTTVPTGWTVIDNAGTLAVWRFDDPNGRTNRTGGTGGFAIADSDYEGFVDMDTELRTPLLDLSALSRVYLEFKYDFAQYQEEVIAVDFSTDGGANWSNAWQFSGADDPGPNSVILDLSAQLSGQSNVMLRFHYYNANYELWWQIDDVFLTDDPCVPSLGGLVVGNVYDQNTLEPVNDARVQTDTFESTMTTATLDPNQDDGFYVLFSPSGAHDITANRNLYSSQTINVNVTAGAAVQQDFYLSTGLLEAAPDSLSVTLELGDSDTKTFDLSNVGSLPVDYAIIEQTGVYTPAAQTAETITPTPANPRRIDLSLSGSPGISSLPAAAWPSSGPVELYLDDGSMENSIGLTTGGQILWFNRFTPNPADFPFLLDQVSALFSSTTFVGDDIEIVIWEDLDLDGDPSTNANLLYTENVTVQYNDGVTWNVYDLSSPVQIEGPADVLVGLVNRSGAVGYYDYPAGIDQGTSLSRSWIGSYTDIPPEPPTLPPSNLWGLIDDFGYPGNWTLRASGYRNEPDVPWLSETPTDGSLPGGVYQTVNVQFDASAVSQPGTYDAVLEILHTAPQPSLYIPVEMVVTPPASMAKLEGTVTGLSYCDTTSAPLNGVEVEITGASGVITTTTDSTGAYALWVDAADSPFTVAVSPDSFLPGQSSGIVITGGETKTVDFTLRLDQPCASAAPSSFDIDVAIGTSRVKNLTLANGGAVDFDWSISEAPPLLHPLGLAASIRTAPVPSVVTIGDLTFSTNPDPPSRLVPSAGVSFPNATTITHSASQTIIPGYSVSCNSGGLHTDNHYLRVFRLADFGIIEPFDVADVQIGIEKAEAGSGGAQPAEIRLYELNGDLLWSNMTLLASAPVSVPDGTLAILNMPVAATVPTGSTLVVDFFTPSGQADMNSLYVGSNNLGQTSPTYLAASACGVSEPADIASLGYPEMHLVMNVVGEIVQTDIPWISEDPLAGTVPADGTFAGSITFTAFPTMTVGSTYSATLGVKTNDPSNKMIVIPVSMNVVDLFYGVSLSSDQAQGGLPGETAAYTVTVTNTGSAADTFDLSVSGGWLPVVTPASVTLDPQESQDVVVEVSIPPGALAGNSRVVTLTAASQGDSTVVATTKLTTSVLDVKGAVLTALGAALTGAPGSRVTYQVELTNNGNAAATFLIQPSGSAFSVQVNIPVGGLALNIGESATFTVDVDIPLTADFGQTDQVKLTAMSGGINLAETTLTTTVMGKVFLPLVVH